jgi:LysR family carnitine catabolism transcriptional activator
MVRENRCELGITFDPGDVPELNFEALYDDRFVAILPNIHPLLDKATLQWTDILQYPHISLQRPAGTRLLIDKALARENLILTPVFESHQLVSIGRMVTQGLGLSVVPSTSKAQMIEMGLHCREISSPQIIHKIGIVTRRKAALSVAAQALLSLIRIQVKL